jgi:hypothetical protein
MNVRLRPIQGLKRMEFMTNRAVLLAALGVGTLLVAAMVARADRDKAPANGDATEPKERPTLRGVAQRARAKVDEGRARVAGLAGATLDRFDRAIGELPPDSPLLPVRKGLGWVATHATPAPRPSEQTYVVPDYVDADGDDSRPTSGAPTHDARTPAMATATTYMGPGVETAGPTAMPDMYGLPGERYLPPVRHLYPRV